MRLLTWEGLSEATESPELEGKRAKNFRLLREWVEMDQAAGRITSRFSADKVLALSTFARFIPVAMPKVFLLTLGMDEPTDAEDPWRDFIFSILAPDSSS